MEKGTLGKKLFAFFSLSLFSSLILGYLWWGRFQYDHHLFQVIVDVGAVLIVAANHIYHRDTLLKLGFRWDNFRRAAIGYGTPTLILGILICGLGWLGGSLRLDRWSDLLTYFAWAAVQQYLLQNFLRLRSEDLFGLGKESSSARRALVPVLLAATLFALYHLPNYPLVGATFVGGLFWCFLFTRIPNLFWVWLSQAFLTTLLLLFFKYDWANQFEVGSPGYRYDFYGGGVKVAAGYDGHRNPIIATLPGADRGTPAQVRIFDARGLRLAEWNAFEELDFSGEISVGDLGFGPGDEVAVAPGPGPNNPPRVRIFDLEGNLLGQFEAEDLDRGYGAWLSIHCGKLYVSPGPGPERPQQVLEFSPQGQLLRKWEFNDLGLVNGLRAAALCSDPAGATHERQASSLLMFASDISINPSTLFFYDIARESVRSLETLSTTFGVNATLVRLADNGLGVGVAPGPLQGYPPVVLVVDLEGKKLSEFGAFEDPETFGSNIAAVDFDGDGLDEVVLGEGIGPGRPARVRIYRLDGQPVADWDAYED
jgi:hypothetical protein